MLPLFAEIRTDAPAHDGRSAARRTLHLEVPAHSARSETEALIHNLSENGLLLETSAKLEVGESIRVDLPHAGTTSALVVWKREQLAGCEFIHPVTKAAVSAALLIAPVQLIEHPQAFERFRSASETKLSDEDGGVLASQTLVIISLAVSLFIALAIVVALLRFPFAT